MMGASIVVTGIVIFFVLLIGAFKNLLCAIFPVFKYIIWASLIAGLPLFIVAVEKCGSQLETTFERGFQAGFITIVYIVFLLAIKLVLVPINAVTDIFKIANASERHYDSSKRSS